MAPHPLVEIAVQVCAELGVTEFVVAPGSRSAPITVALARHPAVRARVVYDERSAGYVALGLAQQTGRPVGLVCTSGTAAVNFGPAVVEAFYQGVPLIVFTADRPPEWIDQQDNQAIRQHNLYGQHTRASYTLPSEEAHADARRHAARLVAEAVQIAAGPPAGPVHVNVPLREPLYAATGAGEAGPPDVPHIIRAAPARPALGDATWHDLAARWQAAQRKLIVGGLHAPDPALHAALRALGADPTVAVVGDVTANLVPGAGDLPRWDVALGTRDPAARAALAPDLVVSFGGQVTSKYLRALLRGAPPAALWHVAPALPAPDTFQALTLAVPMVAADFFAGLAAPVERNSSRSAAIAERDESRFTADAERDAARSTGYRAAWRAAERAASAALDGLLAAQPFGEFAALDAVLRALPEGGRLQLGNSMPIRYANFTGVYAGHVPADVRANRGTSGIDGTVSTAVGAALAGGATHTLTTLIVGDLGFFYDRNGLWHPNVPPQLRIVVLNNHGGGIFDIIEGPDRLDASLRRDYFLTPQPLTARRTAEDHGLAYFHACDAPSLAAALPEFFAPAARPALLEIETEMATNGRVFQEFRAMVARLTVQ